MELHQIRYFLSLARSLNFTRAAEQCNVSQPALTKAIQKLEQELGGELIHRERQLTQLTDLGKLVLPMAERTLAAADSVRSNAREFKHRDLAPLRIGLTPCVSATLLVAPLSEIARTLPGLQVELIESSGAKLLDQLQKGEIAAALAGDLGTLPDRIDRWRLFEERYVVLSSSRKPLANENLIDWSCLVDAVWLDRADSDVIKRFCRTHRPDHGEPNVVHRGFHDGHLQHMVAAGLGIMLAPEHAPRLDALRAYTIAGDPLRREVQLLVMAGRRYSPALDRFLKVVYHCKWTDMEDSVAVRSPKAESILAALTEENKDLSRLADPSKRNFRRPANVNRPI